MEQAAKQLELSPTAYHTLEQIAQREGITPPRLIENWMQQYQQKQTLHTLRQEYQELIGRDLQRVLTPDEEQRFDSVCAELNAIEMQSDTAQHWQRQADAIDRQFEVLKLVISALPEQRQR